MRRIVLWAGAVLRRWLAAPPPGPDRALVRPTATLPYAGAQAVPLPAPPGAAALTTQRVRGATRGNYDNLSNQGPSLPSLWTDQPTFAAANDGNLPAAAPSAFRTVSVAELPATGTTSGQPISLASITGTGAQATTTARSPSPERNPTTTGVSPTDADLLRPVLAGPVHPARTGAAIFSDRVSTTSPDSIRIQVGKGQNLLSGASFSSQKAPLFAAFNTEGSRKGVQSALCEGCALLSLWRAVAAAAAVGVALEMGPLVRRSVPAEASATWCAAASPHAAPAFSALSC